MEQWQTIRYLAARGMPLRAIAETVGVSRSAVERAIRQQAHDPYHREPAVQNALDAFRESVVQGIRRGLNGKRLLALVRQEGYSGSRATFYRWLEQVRQQTSEPQNACRFETGPGEQSQFDWSPYMLRIGAHSVRVIVFSLVLGYSRRAYFYPSLGECQDDILDALEAAWRHFGGCCHTLLIDNARTMVLQHRQHTLVWNPCFLAFCGHYRIRPIAATPVHPQTKGKVENPFYHLEQNLLIGTEFRDWEHLNEEIARYMAERDLQPHSTTREPPGQRFEREQKLLLALPARIFLECHRFVRSLNNDGLLSFRANRYCVPTPRGVREVRCRTVQGRTLVLYDPGGKELIRHSIAPPHSPPVLVPACFEHLKTRARLSLATQQQMLRARFPEEPAVESFVRGLVSKHPNHPEKPLGVVLGLIQSVPDPLALLVLAEAAELGLTDPETITALLTRRLSAQPALASDTPVLLPAPAPVLDVERPLSVYAAVLPEGSPNPKKERGS